MQDTSMVVMARRLVIIMLFGAIFAFTFSTAVQYGGRSGAQSHFGASFTCVQQGSPYCTTIQ
ncbi:hypothetical protein DTW90_14770 [Neorhizobium sp. P12A]|uniref:hypothetical protein n=1 Tax=Rhizobium/Agrobacterium group TaxID=227290 RepID=UPI00104AAFEC|nr:MULTISPECIES: hypothetical protein [Rhizobium/Agrobacterium group]KAA0698442.1 hypothetical protein DTW90_14770 [Neorhizobium sp. P12A]